MNKKISKSKTLFQLGCAFSANDFNYPCYCSRGIARIRQYSEGFDQFFSLYNEYVGDSYEDLIITDNTVRGNDDVDEKILNNIPPGVSIKYSYNESKNKYGSENKGSGLLETWLSIKDLIKKYDYVYYHEPRTKILDFSLYESFLKNQNSTFCLEHSDKFHTHSFIIDSKILLEYINTVTPKELAENGISIEMNLPSFLKEKKYNNFSTVDKIGIIWYDQMGALVSGLYTCLEIEDQFGLERRY